MRLLLALLLFSSSVFGQTTTQPVPHCWPSFGTGTILSVTPNPTSPVPVGQFVYKASQAGLVYGWACNASDGVMYHVVVAALWTQFVPEWAWLADRLMRATDADRVAVWNQYIKNDVVPEALAADVAAVKALLPTPPPPTPQSEYVVLGDPFRTDKKRLIYTTLSGPLRRGPAVAPAQYIDAGAPCNSAVTITEFGGVLFMSVNGNLATVARCVKK